MFFKMMDWDMFISVKKGWEKSLTLGPSLPKSSKYIVRRCLDPLKAFSGGVGGSTHLLKGIWKSRVMFAEYTDRLVSLGS